MNLANIPKPENKVSDLYPEKQIGEEHTPKLQAARDGVIKLLREREFIAWMAGDAEKVLECRDAIAFLTRGEDTQCNRSLIVPSGAYSRISEGKRPSKSRGHSENTTGQRVSYHGN